MFEGHNAYLVAFSVIIAILGGYTGFGLAARLRGSPLISRRLLLTGSAGFLAVGIWTMHFVGMLAAPIPEDAAYLILPTVISFLICALVVGVSLFLVSLGEPSILRSALSALLLGAGIVSMHYVGIHSLQGNFHLEHQTGMILLSVLIAISTAYGGLRVFLARQGGRRLMLSASAFGIAVSGMHYTAMYGMRFVPGTPHDHVMTGLTASSQALALIVAVLCFLIVAGFLLFLVPESRTMATPAGAGLASAFAQEIGAQAEETVPAVVETKPTQPNMLPLRGLGQPQLASASRLPVESVDGVQFLEISEIRSVKANAHYTMVHDGSREYMCPWSISEAEAQLDSALFFRVHRSHIISVPHVTLMRREGDGAVVKLDGTSPHLVPVSRPKIAELRSRLGLLKHSSSAH